MLMRLGRGLKVARPKGCGARQPLRRQPVCRFAPTPRAISYLATTIAAPHLFIRHSRHKIEPRLSDAESHAAADSEARVPRGRRHGCGENVAAGLRSCDQSPSLEQNFHFAAGVSFPADFQRRECARLASRQFARFVGRPSGHVVVTGRILSPAPVLRYPPHPFTRGLAPSSHGRAAMPDSTDTGSRPPVDRQAHDALPRPGASARESFHGKQNADRRVPPGGDARRRRPG